MASSFLAGLSGGAASNNMNVVQWMTGRKIVRSTVVKAGAYSARTGLSRVAITEYVAQTPYTLKTS